MIYVLAADHRRAVEWCRGEGLSPRSREVFIIDAASPHLLRGRRIKPDELVRVDDFYGDAFVEELLRVAMRP